MRTSIRLPYTSLRSSTQLSFREDGKKASLRPAEPLGSDSQSIGATSLGAASRRVMQSEADAPPSQSGAQMQQRIFATGDLTSGLCCGPAITNVTAPVRRLGDPTPSAPKPGFRRPLPSDHPFHLANVSVGFSFRDVCYARHRVTGWLRAEETRTIQDREHGYRWTTEKSPLHRLT